MAWAGRLPAVGTWDEARGRVARAVVAAVTALLGWGLAVNMTPMSASAITTARWAGVSPWTVSTAWNAAFTFSALVFSWLAIGALFILL